MFNHEGEGKVTIGGSSPVTSSAFVYVASGGLTIGGCSLNNSFITIKAKFKEGDAAYEERLARKGRVEKMIIKKLIVLNNERTGGLYQINYVDTLNAVFIEEELVDHQTAIDLATAYLEQQQQLALELLQNSCG